MITRTSDASLLHYNTMGIQCHCHNLITYSTSAELRQLWEEGIFQSRWLHLGAGANTLFDCDYFPGTVLISLCKSFDKDKAYVRAGSGWIWDDLVVNMLQNGCFGAENLSGIPASAGGAVVQNIGAYGIEIQQIAEKIEAFDTSAGKFIEFAPDECKFAYRTSAFKHIGCPYIITNVRLKYNTAENWTPNLKYKALANAIGENPTPWDLRALVLAQRNSKLPDPAITGNVGSFFVNPVVSEAKAKKLAAKYPDMPQYDAPNGIKLAAGWLIEKAGLKGFQLGKAAVDSKNALVLINLGGASGADILRLANHVTEKIHAKFGISLSPEVNIIK